MRIVPRGVFLVCLMALLGCPPGPLLDLAEQVRDDDDDGWFNHARNHATTLTLDSGRFALPGEYRFIVDGVRFPQDPDLQGSRTVELGAAGSIVTVGIPVARRVSGTSLLQAPQTGMAYSASVRVQQRVAGVWIDVGSATVPFTDATATLAPLAIGPVTLNFSTDRVEFADPNPQDALADGDGDGITEREEALLSEAHAGLGDPRPGMTSPSSRDLILILAWTHADAAPVGDTLELLRSRFAFRDVNLWIDDGTLNGQSGFGGAVANPPAAPITLADATGVFNSRVPAGRRRFVHFGLLDRSMVSAGGTSAFGVGNFPGRVFATRSRLAPPFPEIRDYQAGVIMHEFGHNLNLCHPTDVPCASGTLPPGERDPGISIMGTPAENPPITIIAGLPAIPDPMALINAMRRPLDYAPTQWTNLSLTAGLPPP